MGMLKPVSEAWQEWRATRLSKKCAELSAAGRIQEAYDVGREGLGIMEATFGDIFQTSVHTYNLVSICRALGRDSEALEYIARSEEIAKKRTEELLNRPVGDYDLAEAVTHTARALLLKDHGPELPEFLERVFQTRAEEFGEPDRLLIESLIGQADVELQLGYFREAKVLFSALAGWLAARRDQEDDALDRVRQGTEAAKRAMQAATQAFGTVDLPNPADTARKPG